MELFDPKLLKINFSKTFNFFVVVSSILCVLSAIAIFYPGFNYGIDFRGGIEAQVEFNDPAVNSQAIRDAIGDKVKNLTIVESSKKDSGLKKEYYLNVQADDVNAGSKQLKEVLEQAYPGAYKLSKMDTVGPKIGAELRKSALLSLFYTCILIALYIYWRFDIRYSPGAIIAVIHDLLLTSGFLIVTRMEFSTTVVAALLTLAGYSINDTIVVFDRIRELEARVGSMDRKNMLNLAVNSTLSRTVMTAGTTLMCCVVLYFFGGAALREFSAAIFFGIIVGTYSSIFIAAPTYLLGDRLFSDKSSTLRARKV
ncbi:MAG: protein translocase subunit SecF [Proteobacteria bacterium]|nr:protein translocase subunit SecF [Pseudomonadota bacterium]